MRSMTDTVMEHLMAGHRVESDERGIQSTRVYANRITDRPIAFSRDDEAETNFVCGTCRVENLTDDRETE